MYKYTYITYIQRQIKFTKFAIVSNPPILCVFLNNSETVRACSSLQILNKTQTGTLNFRISGQIPYNQKLNCCNSRT